MVQIEPETLAKLKLALQHMKPFELECNKTAQSPRTNIISIEWTKKDHYINRNTFSVIDGRDMCGIKSMRLTNMNDYVNDTKSIRWTEIFMIKIEEESTSENENNFNLNAFADMCAQAFCHGLIPLLDDLVLMQKNFLSIRKKKVSDGKQIKQAEGGPIEDDENTEDSKYLKYRK